MPRGSEGVISRISFEQAVRVRGRLGGTRILPYGLAVCGAVAHADFASWLFACPNSVVSRRS